MTFLFYAVAAIPLAVAVHYLFHLRANRKIQMKMNALGDRLHEIR